MDKGYEAEFRIAIDSEESARTWIKQYQKISKVTLRVAATKPTSGKANLFKIFYRCQHKTLPRSVTANQKTSSKNTHCPAQLNLTVKGIPAQLNK